jgi:pyridoxamine 5'-phosphate oxidase-like protein
MATWSDFTTADPELAAATRALFEQYGPGLAYLATIRPDGAPRLHPVSPVFTDEGLYCFIVASPKRGDLSRDGRYALHSFPPEESDDEAYLTGKATRVTDPIVIATLSEALRASPAVDWHLYELQIKTATLRRHGPAGAIPLAAAPAVTPMSRTWRAELSRPLAAVS